MRAYRTTWRGLMVVLAVGAGLVGVVDVGWLATIGTSVAFASLGALFGFSWIEEPAHRPRIMAECALWFGVAGVLIIGLPPVIGAWTLPMLLVLGLTCPPLLQFARQQWRREHPVVAAADPLQLSDRDLARRWRWTGDELQDRSLPVAAALGLVEERSALLDELERRDPEGFGDWLARSGWREPQDR